MSHSMMFRMANVRYRFWQFNGLLIQLSLKIPVSFTSNGVFNSVTLGLYFLQQLSLVIYHWLAIHQNPAHSPAHSHVAYHRDHQFLWVTWIHYMNSIGEPPVSVYDMIITVLPVSSNMHTKVSWCTCSNWIIVYKYAKRFQATGSIQHSMRTQGNGCWIGNISRTMSALVWTARRHICITSTICNKTAAFASPATQTTVVHKLN